MCQDRKALLAAIAGHYVTLDNISCRDQSEFKQISGWCRDDRDGSVQEDMKDRADRAKSASRVCAHAGVVPLHPTVSLWSTHGLSGLDCSEHNSAGKQDRLQPFLVSIP